MPINKVVFGNTTLIDLTQSTLDSAGKLLSGITAYDKAGNLLTGTIPERNSLNINITTDDLLDTNGTIMWCYISSAGEVKSSGKDKCVLIPLAINTDYIFTWYRTALTEDSDDAHIGVFSSYPAVGSTGRRVGLTRVANGGEISFTTSSTECYAIVKIGHIDKTNFSQSLSDSSLYVENAKVIVAASGFYKEKGYMTIPTASGVSF